MKAEYDFSQANRGAVIPQVGKTRVVIFVDDDILGMLQKQGDQNGKGYQHLINDALRAYLNEPKPVLNQEVSRQVLQEELNVVV